MAAHPKKTFEDFQKKWAHIIKLTARDDVFKQRLLHNPMQVLREHGIEIPEGKTIKIVENTKTIHYLSLPEKQMAKDLSEEELRKVAGGARMPLEWQEWEKTGDTDLPDAPMGSSKI